MTAPRLAASRILASSLTALSPTLMLEAVVLLFLVSKMQMLSQLITSNLSQTDERSKLTWIYEFCASQCCGRRHHTGGEQVAGAHLEGDVSGQHGPRNGGKTGCHHSMDLGFGHVLQRQMF